MRDRSVPAVPRVGRATLFPTSLTGRNPVGCGGGGLWPVEGGPDGPRCGAPADGVPVPCGTDVDAGAGETLAVEAAPDVPTCDTAGAADALGTGVDCCALAACARDARAVRRWAACSQAGPVVRTWAEVGVVCAETARFEAGAAVSTRVSEFRAWWSGAMLIGMTPLPGRSRCSRPSRTAGLSACRPRAKG